MIWYLLYPLRRTSDPAILRDGHLIRRAISYLGTVVAQHSVTTILVTVTIGVSLCVPIPFLYHQGSSMSYPRLPDHVWTSAESFMNGEDLIPDISIKQAWIHGSWMKALERETLMEALAIQDVLLGPTLSCNTEPNVNASFLHSPLLYWNCSVTAIESDSSVLTTINSRAGQISPANITLKPSSVLVGMLLFNNRLVAADTIVISLFYKAESKAGDLWDDGAKALARRYKSRWDVYPAGGRGTGSRLFRFQSRPISFQDGAIFFSAYSLVVLYIVFSLRNLRMLKSRVGLFLTIALQESFSILSSFTLAAFLHIDVSNIPPEAYPFIVLVVGLENMFRLVNEVEKRPLQDQSVPRMATALGAVGHLSLIAVVQNLVVLWFLSVAASPTLVAFYGFVAISLVIDLVFFFTFFVAMLTVNLRKYGLQDTFDEVRQNYEDDESTKATFGNKPAQRLRSDIKQRSKYAPLPHPRVLGTAITFLFLSILGWHFFEGMTIFHWARKFAAFFGGREFKVARQYQDELNATLEQGRDSVGWLEMQDRETLNEILSMANPRLYGFLARVYNPLVIILKPADRNPSTAQEIKTSSPIHDRAFGPLSLPVFLFCCVVALMLTLWYCCLSNDTSDETGDRSLKPGILSSIQCLPCGHKLDVFILGTSSKRVLASVGFDHEIRVWNLESRIMSSQLVPASQHKLWPVASIAIDDKAEWLAICSKSGEVSFWNIRLQCFGRSTTINLDTHIVACFFTSSLGRDGPHPATRLLLVSAAGRLTDIEVDTVNVVSHQICANGVQSSHVNSHRRMPLKLITVSEDNKIYITARRGDLWTSQVVHFSVPLLNQPSRLRFTIIPDLRMVALVLNMDTSQLHLIDLLSGASIYTICPRPFNHHTLRAIHSPPQQCLSCGAVALISFSIAYTEEQDGSFTMVTLSAEQTPRFRTGLICLRAERDTRERRCIGFEGGTERTFSMQHAGVWEATGANGVAGVRIKRQDPQKISKAYTQNGTLLRRMAELTQKNSTIDEGPWEAWTMTAMGIINIHALTVGILTNRAGPICSVGRNAIATGLAEDIVIIQFGNQLHDDDDDIEAAARKPPRIRLAGRSKLGQIDRSRT